MAFVDRRKIGGLVLAVVPIVACQGMTARLDAPGAATAGASARAPTGAAPRTPNSDPVVDLLHTVDATVAVSSKVDNPLDFPEHLVDGKPETAWNSKTGDVHGFISFRVPKSARVTRVELTVGFDKIAPKGDLFTMNYRITKVRLSREGKVIREAALDSEKRGLQALDID